MFAEEIDRPKSKTAGALQQPAVYGVRIHFNKPAIEIFEPRTSSGRSPECGRLDFEGQKIRAHCQYHKTR
jgi:hypothetical protein